MSTKFKGITSEEYKSLKDAIALITILVAGADNNIDQEEKEWAEKLTRIRSYANDDTLHDFYNEVGETFSEDLEKYIEELPSDVSARNLEISRRLNSLNAPLSHVPNLIGAKLYQSYKSFAEHVAKSSGGVMRFFTISGEEKAVMGLDMLHEIILEEEE